MRKGPGKMLPEAGMAGTEAGQSKPVLRHGTAAVQRHVVRRGQKGRRRSDAARPCAPWSAGLVPRLTERSWREALL